MNKTLFYILSFLWGLPLTLIGLVVALALIITGHKPQKWGYCWYFTIGKTYWGGLEFGPIFLMDKSNSVHIKNHEFGHGLQNCVFGPAMIFVVGIPSAIRYWYRKIRYYNRNQVPPTDYDDIWFEGMASSWGTKEMDKIRKWI